MTILTTARPINTTPVASAQVHRGGVMAGAKESALFCKDTLQGVAAGALSIIGALHISAEDLITTNSEIFVDAGLLEGLSMGRSMGFIEVLAAIFLFLATRRGIARALGVLLVFTYIILTNSGYTTADLAAIVAASLHQIADRIDPALMAMTLSN